MTDSNLSVRLKSLFVASEPPRFTAAEKGKGAAKAKAAPWPLTPGEKAEKAERPEHIEYAGHADHADGFSDASSSNSRDSRPYTPPSSPTPQHAPAPSAPHSVTAKIVRSSVSSASIENWGTEKDGFVTFAVRYTSDGGKPETYNIAISVHGDSPFINSGSPSDAQKRAVEKTLCELVDVARKHPSVPAHAHRTLLTIGNDGKPTQAKVCYYDENRQERTISLLDEEIGKQLRRGALQQTSAEWLDALSERLARLAKNELKATVEKAATPGNDGRAAHAVI